MGNIKTKYSEILIGASIALALFFSPGASNAQTKPKYEFTYYEGYQQGLEAAKSANKPILLDFYFDT